MRHSNGVVAVEWATARQENTRELRGKASPLVTLKLQSIPHTGAPQWQERVATGDARVMWRGQEEEGRLARGFSMSFLASVEEARSQQDRNTQHSHPRQCSQLCAAAATLAALYRTLSPWSVVWVTLSDATASTWTLLPEAMESYENGLQL